MTKFSELNLNPKVLKAVVEAGYEIPTPIQEGAIPPALEGRDVLGIAQTGTGKTAGFTLPMLSLLARGRARARMPRSLVLCPTRELAAQVAENFDTYSKHLKLTKALLIGGVSFKDQDKLIDKGVDVLIATPGRLLDHFERGKLLLTGVQIMVVDEADRMLDMGFIPDIERIFSLTPFTRQTLFFSATMAPEIERITNTFLQAPVRIEVARQATASETIEQGVVMFKASRRDREASEKRDLLRAMIDAEGDKCSNAIIFCNRKVDVDIIAKSLKKYGYDAAPIHGDLEQSQRTRTLDGFRAGDLRFLVASDVAARGLDVPAVSHVFNYDVPSHAEDYVHRIGRTGRAGRAGKAMMLCAPRDEKNFEAIERLLQKEIPRLASPIEQSEPAELAEDSAPTPKPRKVSTRGRSKPAHPPEDAAEVNPPQDEPLAKEADKPKPKPRAKAQDKPQAKTQESSDRGKSGGRGKSDKGGNKVVGMGDHMPSFIALSFDERRAG
ncbi:ATP-dependent RNA helicase RhlE [Salinihabitans flavidus]|uniref:DEAD-box ATP-dependent RNA helicase RhpA n=1 Tax=Salinihabitans flavidus TaxID=569882 RepID=A0A1H8N951_9RHOB|nr:DEAD/DEAH box helicase [Salinihabitans flavidus]SEO26082.1 ATP-dependent RNA helicase RhlE [Salinihabitans flavidus]